MKTPYTKENPFTLNRHGYLWEILRQHPSARHLDYGACTGGIIRGLVESGVASTAIGVELNAEVVLRSAAGMPEGATLLPIEKGAALPFDDASFDSASLLDVLEHVGDQEALLREIRRVLKPGGHFVVTVPGRHVFSALDTGNFKFRFPRAHKLAFVLRNSEEEYRRRYVDCEHGLFGDVGVEKMWHQHFGREELAALLRQAGFEVVAFDGTGLFERPFVLAGLLSSRVGRLLRRAHQWDARRFEHTNLFALARASAEPGTRT